MKRKCCENPCGGYTKEFGKCGKYVAKNSPYLICVAQRRESPCGGWWWLWLWAGVAVLELAPPISSQPGRWSCYTYLTHVPAYLYRPDDIHSCVPLQTWHTHLHTFAFATLMNPKGQRMKIATRPNALQCVVWLNSNAFGSIDVCQISCVFLFMAQWGQIKVKVLLEAKAAFIWKLQPWFFFVNIEYAWLFFYLKYNVWGQIKGNVILEANAAVGKLKSVHEGAQYIHFTAVTSEIYTLHWNISTSLK